MIKSARTNGGKCRELLRTVIIWGCIWGIFESTVGYLLHLLPVSLGWLVWYPVACFFMAISYRKTRKPSAVLCVGILSAAIKLVDLLLPVRIDKVLNPAVSIVFESLTMFCAFKLMSALTEEKRGRPTMKALAALVMNTGWRALYILYLQLVVPDWMREISVIASAEQLVRFLVIHNLATSAVIFAAWILPSKVHNLLVNKPLFRLPGRNKAVNAAAVPCLLVLSILLQLLL